jgi:hypothetical protein
MLGTTALICALVSIAVILIRPLEKIKNREPSWKEQPTQPSLTSSNSDRAVHKKKPPVFVRNTCRHPGHFVRAFWLWQNCRYRRRKEKPGELEATPHPAWQRARSRRAVQFDAAPGGEFYLAVRVRLERCAQISKPSKQNRPLE